MRKFNLFWRFRCFAPVLLFLAASPAFAQQYTIDWGAVGFSQNDSSVDGTDTHLSTLSDPFHGLSGSSGGITGFQFQDLLNVSGSGVDVRLFYSNNHYDGNSSSNLEGPDLYAPLGGSSPNPDRRVTGTTALRMTRDLTTDSGGNRTPFTAVLSFSQPVYVNELIQASLSQVNTSNENALIRAFASNDATGSVIKASGFENISDLADGSSLQHSQWDSTGPTTTNALSNVSVDPDLTLDSGGVATNVGSLLDDGLYHIIGIGNQNDSRYGRVLMEWETTAVQSIAFSYWASPSADFNDYDTTSQWVSTIVAPFSFTPVPEPTSAVLLIGGIALLTLRRPRRKREAA